MESLDNSNLGSPCRDFFPLFFLLVQPVNQKPGFFSQLCHDYLPGQVKAKFLVETRKKRVFGDWHGEERGGAVC